MYLSHVVMGSDIDGKNKILLDILKNGYLKSSIKTGNIKASGYGSPYIYLSIYDKKQMDAHLILDPKLLLDRIFYFNYGWRYEPTLDSIKVNGKLLSDHKLIKLLKKFKKYAIKHINKSYDKKLKMYFMSHEILVKKDISLKKYLKKIFIPQTDKELYDYIKTHYPKVKIEYYASN